MDTTAPDFEELLARANRLAGEGRLADADALFSRVLETEPEHPLALRFKAFQALKTQQHHAAEEFLRRLTARTPADSWAWYYLAFVLYSQGRFEGALAALDETLKIDRNQPGAWLYRGVILQNSGQQDDAVVSFLRGVKIAEKEGVTPQDPEMKRLMAHAAGAVAVELDSRLESALAPVIERHGADALARIRKGADIFVGKRPLETAHPLWSPGLFYIPDLAPRMFFERDEFAWTAQIEAATDEIRNEMRAVLADGEGLKPYVDHAAGTSQARTWASVNQSKDWSTFHFFRHGERYDENCRRCPRTTELLESLDLNRVPGYGPEAMFSVLRPHTRIPAHYGAVNGRVIVHLPLVVPERCGALRVGDQQRAWTEGELVMFDDSFQHEAWNESDETRVVLIFDTWNPQLSVAEREGFSEVLQAAQRFDHLV